MPDDAAWETAALWRRGIMHAVERIDLILSPRKPLPTGKRATEMLALIELALMELYDLQRNNQPASYSDAFVLCAAELRRAAAGPTGADLGPGRTPTPKDEVLP